MSHAPILIVLVAALQGQNHGEDAPPASSPSTARVGFPPAITFVLEPPSQDAQEAGWKPAPQSSADFERDLAKRAALLVEAAAAAEEAERPAMNLKAATYLVGRASEPSLSRILLGIPLPTDADTLAAVASRSRELLKDSLSASSAPATMANTPDPRFMLAITDACAALAAHPIGIAPPDSAERGRLLKAAQAMATFVDDDQPVVSGVARMLQSACYRRGGKPERTIEILSSPAAATAPAPYQVFGWLEYCRAMADKDGYAAAIALTTRLEARVGGTLPVAHRTPAAHSLRALRMTLLEDWADRLRSLRQAVEASGATAHAMRISNSFHATGPVPLLRLGTVLVGLAEDDK